jgi:hypothetical protein
LEERRNTVLKKGQRVEELTKKAGQRPRTGVVIDLRGETIDVRWDDGHISTLVGGLLKPVHNDKHPK